MDERELVAAEASNRVRLTRAPAQPQRHRLEQEIAELVPERVVHVLEVVEVDEQDRDQLAGAVRLRDRLLQPILEQYPVRQVGQRIVVCECQIRAWVCRRSVISRSTAT